MGGGRDDHIKHLILAIYRDVEVRMILARQKLSGTPSPVLREAACTLSPQTSEIIGFEEVINITRTINPHNWIMLTLVEQK